MKGFGRAFELNCLFLVVVALLVALQLVLQRSHHKELLVQLKERGEGEEEEGQQHQDPLPLAAPLHLSAPDIPPPDAKALGKEGVEGGGGGAEGGGDKTLAAPIVPNIRRSFPKRKAPYVRKAKKNKKKKKNRKGNQQQQQQQKEIRAGENGGKGVEGRNSHWGGKGVNSVHEKGEQKGNKQKRGKAGDKAKG